MSSPSPPAGCRSSRPGKRITTRGTNGVVGAVALHPSVVRAPPPGQAHTFTIATRRSIGHETPLLPGRLRPDDRRNSPHGHRSSTMPLTLFAFEPPSAWRRRNSGTCLSQDDRRTPGTQPHPGSAVLRPDTRTPKNRAGSGIPDSARSPCFSGFSGAPPLPPPAVQRQIPAMVRVPALGLEVGCFRFAYAAPRCHQAVEANTVAAVPWWRADTRFLVCTDSCYPSLDRTHRGCTLTTGMTVLCGVVDKCGCSRDDARQLPRTG